MEKRYDHLIIGGGIAGVTAAETIREHDPKAVIGIISDEDYPLYSRVLLPNYLKKKINREQLFLRQVADFISKDIDLLFRQKVSGVKTDRKAVGLENGRSFGYGKLLVASGGKVRPWGELELQDFIYRLQTLDDADRLFQNLEGIKKPLVIGGSFISLEFLEIFVANGVSPTLLFDNPHFFSRLIDEKGGEMMRKNFESHGVKVLAGERVKNLEKKPNGMLEITTTLGHTLENDAVAVGIGLDRNLEFLRGSSIELGESGICANEFLETSQEGVWAAGDAAEFYDLIFEKHRLLGNWTNSFLQGKIAGLNMLGERQAFRGVSSYSITNLGFQITVLGECDRQNADKIIVRYDQYRHLYECFFTKERMLRGAVLINCFKDKTILTRLVENRVNLGPYLDKLTSFDFDLKEIKVIN